MDKSNINTKSSPNQMRILMKRMRDGLHIVKEEESKTKPNPTMRDLLKITRNLNEDVNKKTAYDQGTEEKKFLNYIDNLNVNVKFIDLEVYDNLVFWGGTVDGIIQFIYKVTPDESTSGVEFNYLNDFTPDNPENDKIIEMIENYYDTFYKFWRNNILQK